MQYEVMRFHDFVEGSIAHIINEKMDKQPSTVVELGVYNGYFTFNMLHMMCQKNPNYTHYSIDPYMGYNEFNNNEISKVRSTFLKNLEMCPYKDNVNFIEKPSSDALIDLIGMGVTADLVYIDGDHRAAAVLQDLVLSWKILRVGGAVLMDDAVNWCYTDDRREKPLQMSPRLAVDSFIHCFWDKLEVVHLPNGYQSAFIKRAY